MSHFTDSTFVGIGGICAGVASLILSASRTLRYCWRKLSWYFCLLHFWIAIGNLFLVLVVSRVGNDLVIGWFGSDNILFSVALQCFSIKLAIGVILYFLISSSLCKPMARRNLFWRLYAETKSLKASL